jgi:RsiW-degrading membrane proteinase PrsW (M82 family)
MWYADRLDRKRPEPLASRFTVAFAGALAVLPCAWLEQALSQACPGGSIAGAFFMGFVVAAAVEEAAKLVCLRTFIWRSREFDERMDGILYGAWIGLGFAMVENVFYLWQTQTVKELVVTASLRALLAVPLHGICGGLSGYLWAKRRFDGTGSGLVGGYLVAVTLHGTFDAALFAVGALSQTGLYAMAAVLLPIPVIVVVAGSRALRRGARFALAADDAAAAAAGLAGAAMPPAPLA